MSAVIDRRVCAEIDGPFVLFLIGMRINHFWKIAAWLPVIRAMTRMLIELGRNPQLGLLHARSHFGLRNVMVVQYWRDMESLQAYATARDAAHLPAWTAFNTAIGSSGDVGIWHETYRVDPGGCGSLYHNMPAYGLGIAGTLRDATGVRARAAGRLAATIGTGTGGPGKG